MSFIGDVPEVIKVSWLPSGTVRYGKCFLDNDFRVYSISCMKKVRSDFVGRTTNLSPRKIGIRRNALGARQYRL
jgi:hypothetical protein